MRPGSQPVPGIHSTGNPAYSMALKSRQMDTRNGVTHLTLSLNEKVAKPQAKVGRMAQKANAWCIRPGYADVRPEQGKVEVSSNRSGLETTVTQQKGAQPIEDWKTLPWKQYQRNVFRLQKRIYRAEQRGDWRCVRKLQRLLLRSRSAQCLAVRKVTQDNRGKRTAGIDGKARLTPQQRLALALELRSLTQWVADPLRRKYIPKPGSTEKRGLGIPTMRDRAMQALVTLAMEPQWEAVFEPNVYGFRTGRCAQDAIEAIFNYIHAKPKYVLDADIEKCFDRIGHEALMEKLNVSSPIRRLVRAWLKAGILDEGKMLFPEAGTPQGGVISPLLANIALHGLETAIKRVSKTRHPVAVIRYADDLVMLCEDLPALAAARVCLEDWLAEMGLRLKANKTHFTHTLEPLEGRVGFNFLGFNVRQYAVGKYRTYTYRGKPGMKTITKPSSEAIKRHIRELHTLVHKYRGKSQMALIATLHPVIQGWANYYRASAARGAFEKADHLLDRQLRGWARWRHPRKTTGWQRHRYWRQQGNRKVFSDGVSVLTRHCTTSIARHVKVQGLRSPFDGDWMYWGLRLQRDPAKPRRLLRMLKQQHGRCEVCGLHFMADDVIEEHHRDGNHANHRLSNRVLLHNHCHDQLHATQYL
jgi:RNA-directed DNA polymerase